MCPPPTSHCPAVASDREASNQALYHEYHNFNKCLIFIKIFTQIFTNILGTMAMLQPSVVSNYCITKFQISSANSRKGQLCLAVPTSLLASLNSWVYLDKLSRIKKVQEDSIIHAHIIKPLPASHHLPQPKLSKLLPGHVQTLLAGVKCVQSAGVLLILAML